MLTKEGLIMSMGRAYLTIYYNDNENIYEDDDGIEYGISIIMDDDQVNYYKKNGGTCYARVDEEDFEIVFPVRELNRTLYYDEKDNVVYDEYGATVFNIFSIVMPSSLYLFKSGKKTIEVRGVNGGWVELVWPDPIGY